MTDLADRARGALHAQPFSMLLGTELTHVGTDELTLRLPVRDELKQRGIRAVIPPKSNRTKAIRYNKRLYRQRNCIGRVLGHLKINRAVATRYDQTMASSSSASRCGSTPMT